MSDQNVLEEATRHEGTRTVVISMVKCATDTETRDISVEKVLEGIRTGGKKLKGQIEQIRNKFEAELDITGDLKAAKLVIGPLKKELPGVMWSGQYSSRKEPVPEKLRKHSGLFIADLDNLGDKLPEIRKQLEASPHVFALFLSPSGNGLKVVFRVRADASKHAANFRAVEAHVKQLTGIEIDESGKDIGRLCFMSYDPDIYVNENAIELEPLPEPEKPKATFNSSGEVNLSERQRIATELLGGIDWESETSGFCVCTGKHLHTTGDGERDCKIEMDGVPTVHCFHNHCRGILDAINRELRSRIGKAEFVPMPRIEAQPRDGETVELPPPPPPYVSPPLALLPAVLQDYIHAAAESLTVDVAYILLPKLSSIASAIGNSRSIVLKPDYIEPPVIWTGIIGNISSRKSPSIQSGCFAISLHERELVRQNEQAKEQFADELAQWEAAKKALRGAKPELPVIATCKMDDLTLEALADRLEQNPRGVLVAKDELSHWLASFDQYRTSKGSDVSRWLSIHTGVEFGIDRRSENRHYRIWLPRVSITGGIQPRVLRRVLTEDYFERGLPARFLFAYPPFHRARWSEVTIPDRLTKAVRDLFDELWLLQPNRDERGQPAPILLRPDGEAKASFVRYYNECGDWAAESDEREEAAWGKLSGYAARLALVGQLGRNPASKIITADTMQAACELSQWFGVEAARIYATLAETTEQRERRELIEFIERRGGDVYERDVMQSFTRLKNNKAGTERELTALVKAGLGNWEPVLTTERGGRPARKFHLLRSSTSTQPLTLRGKTRGSVDVDSSSSQKNEGSGSPVDGAAIDGSTAAENADADTSGSQEITGFGEPQSEVVSGDLRL